METDEPVQPELSLNEVKTDQANGRNRVLMNLQNKQAAMIKNYKSTPLYIMKKKLNLATKITKSR